MYFFYRDRFATFLVSAHRSECAAVRRPMAARAMTFSFFIHALLALAKLRCIYTTTRGERSQKIARMHNYLIIGLRSPYAYSLCTITRLD